ncbi:MAG: VWA domain-containing protein [Chloroflexi bacterium]|nr:VWA domain-containing protein [Chloroflexota bacterium]
MGVSFGQPWALLLLIPVLGGAVLLWSSQAGLPFRTRPARGWVDARSAVILNLRLVLLAALVLALAAPSLRLTVDRQAVVFVADLSASTAEEHTQAASFIRGAMEARGADNLAGVVVVGRDGLVEWPVGQRSGFREFQSLVDDEYTSLADGLRLAGALLPEDARRRIVLLSDGQENLGSALDQVRFLRARGVQVDIVPLRGLRGPEALVAAVEAPSTAREGERLPVRVTVRSTGATPAKLRLTMDGVELASIVADLEPGENRFAFSVRVERAGFHALRATLDAEADTLLYNDHADAFVNVHGPPRALVVVERDGAVANLAAALQSTGLQVERRPASLFPETLDELGQFAATVLVDVPADALGQERMALLQAATRDLGRGLVAVGGGRSFTMGNYRGTPLEEALPVTSEVPRRQEQGQAAVVFVVDKSGSMSGGGVDGVPKVEMSKEAVRQALEQLASYDLAGVVAFDAAHWWLVSIGDVGPNRDAMQDAVGTLVASGGTNIYPALAAAQQALAQAKAPRKHIILLTDGQSQPGDYQGLLSAMQEHDITLSTIAVGQDADAYLLEWLAQEGQGRFYYTDRASDIPRIMTDETRLASSHAIIEEPVQPLVAGNSPVLTVTGGQFPMLGGYVVTQTKGAAQAVLVSSRGDPLLAQWQYGLGRAIAWTSDSEGRWTAGLNNWERGGTFWSALVDWTLPPEEAPFQVSGSVAGGIAVLAVEGEAQDGATLTARVVGPDLSGADVPLKAVAPGRYEAQFPVAGQGAYLVRVTEQGADGHQRSATGGLVVSYPPEYANLGIKVGSDSGAGLLERIATITGGKRLVQPSAAFEPDLPPAHGSVPLARWFLMAAAWLLPVDVAVRRLNLRRSDLAAARAWLASTRARPTRDEATSPVLGRLRERRTGRARMAAPAPKRSTPPADSSHPAGQPRQPPAAHAQAGPEKPAPESQPEAVSSTKRWLEAKQRARRK